MLTADTDVKLGINGLSKIDSHLHELTDAVSVKLGKRIVLKDLGFVVCLKELASV